MWGGCNFWAEEEEEEGVQSPEAECSLQGDKPDLFLKTWTGCRGSH